jgi:hypothetical protein
MTLRYGEMFALSDYYSCLVELSVYDLVKFISKLKEKCEVATLAH